MRAWLNPLRCLDAKGECASLQREAAIRATIFICIAHQGVFMGGKVAVQAIGAALALALYFLPAIIADRRKRRDLLTLALFNACLGWTVLGWVLALYWSLQPNPAENLASDIVETRKVLTLRAFSSALMMRVRRREDARDRPEH
jgi:hypothetical protein